MVKVKSQWRTKKGVAQEIRLLTETKSNRETLKLRHSLSPLLHSTLMTVYGSVVTNSLSNDIFNAFSIDFTCLIDTAIAHSISPTQASHPRFLPILYPTYFVLSLLYRLQSTRVLCHPGRDSLEDLELKKRKMKKKRIRI